MHFLYLLPWQAVIGIVYLFKEPSGGSPGMLPYKGSSTACLFFPILGLFLLLLVFLFFLPSLPPFSTLFFPTQCYYSLGTLHLLSKNYKEALKYFKKHLNLAQELNDKYTPTLNMSYMYPILKTNAKIHK